MNPHQRLSWALGMSLIIWAPIALTTLSGSIDVTRGGLLYLGALAISWVGTGFIERLINNYRETQNSLYRAKQQIERIEKRAQAERDAEGDQNRRASDYAE